MSVVLASLCAVVLVLCIAGATLGGVALAAHRARADADLSALAAATAEQDRPGSGCEMAEQAIRRTLSQLTSCTADPVTGDIRVRVSRPTRARWIGVAETVYAQAKAGPDPTLR